MSPESEHRAEELNLPITTYRDEYVQDGESVKVFWNEVTSEQADTENPSVPIVYIPG